MKKAVILLCLFLCGCSNGYHLSRNTDTDKIHFAFLSDQEYNSKLDAYETSFYVCDDHCTDTIKEIELSWADGIFVMGEHSVDMMNHYQNVNQIPIITIEYEDELTALKRLFPEYLIWSDDQNEKADAYYINEREEVLTEKPFYQKNNPISLAELEEDQTQFHFDMNQKADEIVNAAISDYNIIIKWKIK